MMTVVRCLFVLFFSINASIAQAAIQGVRYSGDDAEVRFVVDFADAFDVETHFVLENPYRLVVDLSGLSLPSQWSDEGYGMVSQIRGSQRGGKARLVFDLKGEADYTISTLQGNRPRLIVDLKATSPVNVVPVEASGPAVAIVPSDPVEKRLVVVVIDAGHGGHDPGAVYSRSIREKDVVLNIAKELDRIIDARKGYMGVMVRSDDRFVELRDRVKKARSAGADLFISIHADGWKTPSARGASVWTLSDRGASSEMGRWLAKHENDAHLLGRGDARLSLSDKDEVLANVLLDMSMTASRAGSYEVAKAVHHNLSRFAVMHKDHVEQAAFAVLKSPDVPSILVETGFITNPDEARLLNSSRYQRQLAQAIADGVFEYFESKPPMNSYLAHTTSAPVLESYTVRRGDTLSQIAVSMNVPLNRLRQLNGLRGDRILVGQTLRLR